MDRENLIRHLADLRPRFEAEGVKHLSVFGSRARGDNRPESDVDLLVDIDAKVRFSLLDLIGLEHLVTDTTGIVANAVVDRGLDEDFARLVSRDAIRVF